jgi:DNA-binding response OmpR family regulator
MAAAPTREKPKRPATVMVVEPDVLVRTPIAEYLRDCGYRVVEGVVPTDVWKLLGEGIAIDIVLAGVQLTGEGEGFALARLLRAHRPEIDVILTSSVAKAVEKASDLCDDGPLAQPYHPDELVRRIERLLRERRRSGRGPEATRRAAF